MASLLRAAAAAAVPARPDWTPEEAGRYAAARDVALLRAFADDRRLLATARRVQWFVLPAKVGHDGADGQPSARAGGRARPPASTAAAPARAQQQGDTARHEVGRAADRPPPVAAPLLAAVQHERHGAARRPRRRSEAAMAARAEAFEQKRRRRKLLEVLPIVGQWARRERDAVALPPPASMSVDAVLALPAPSTGKRSCERRLSSSAAADMEAGSKRCAGSGGSAGPAAATDCGGTLASVASGTRPQAGALGAPAGRRGGRFSAADIAGVLAQVDGRCFGGCGRVGVQLVADGESRWLCEACRDGGEACGDVGVAPSSDGL